MPSATPPIAVADATRVVLDQTACIRAQSNIGETITHNICDGTTAVVPWGSADWLGFAGLCGVGLVLAVMFSFLAALIVSEVWGRY